MLRLEATPGLTPSTDGETEAEEEEEQDFLAGAAVLVRTGCLEAHTGPAVLGARSPRSRPGGKAVSWVSLRGLSVAVFCLRPHLVLSSASLLRGQWLYRIRAHPDDRT